MIFHETWQQVLDGTKTQTRRLVKCGDCTWRDGESNIITGVCAFHKHRLRWKVGRSYAVQPGRGKHAVGRIGIIKIRREKLQDASDADLLYEGIEFEYVGRDQVEVRQRAWRNLWNNIHKKKGERWEDNPEVWVLAFELVIE